ncbi:unnamed protein product, partial [Phaeothamnion confervicola]
QAPEQAAAPAVWAHQLHQLHNGGVLHLPVETLLASRAAPSAPSQVCSDSGRSGGSCCGGGGHGGGGGGLDAADGVIGITAGMMASGPSLHAEKWPGSGGDQSNAPMLIPGGGGGGGSGG